MTDLYYLPFNIPNGDIIETNFIGDMCYVTIDINQTSNLKRELMTYNIISNITVQIFSINSSK